MIKSNNKLIVYEGFKDIWRNNFYTLSTNLGYMTFPTKKEAKEYLKEIGVKIIYCEKL